jgi:hypothetical protein
MIPGTVASLYDLFEINGDKGNFFVKRYLFRNDTRYHIKSYDLDNDEAFVDIYEQGLLKKIDRVLQDENELYVVVIPPHKYKKEVIYG